MSPRVSCDDCPWSDDADDLLEASDRAEEHEAKEQHRVSIERVATDGGHIPADELADEIEAELCSRLWETDRETVVFKGGRLAEELDVPVGQFSNGLAALREREDARVEIERWVGQNPGKPWEATLTEQPAIADGGAAPGGTAAPPEADVDEAPWDWQIRSRTATNLYDDAMREWGERAQIAKASEECAELAAVLARDLNGQANVAVLLQEIVDVRIMLEQLARTMGLDQDHLEAEVTTRLQHLDSRLNGGEEDA